MKLSQRVIDLAFKYYDQGVDLQKAVDRAIAETGEKECWK